MAQRATTGLDTARIVSPSCFFFFGGGRGGKCEGWMGKRRAHVRGGGRRLQRRRHAWRSPHALGCNTGFRSTFVSLVRFSHPHSSTSLSAGSVAHGSAFKNTSGGHPLYGAQSSCLSSKMSHSIANFGLAYSEAHWCFEVLGSMPLDAV
jgi:hypothetical protein